MPAVYIFMQNIAKSQYIIDKLSNHFQYHSLKSHENIQSQRNISPWVKHPLQLHQVLFKKVRKAQKRIILRNSQ